MARVDVVDLKSLQKISLSEVRYLSEIEVEPIIKIDKNKGQLIDARLAQPPQTAREKIMALQTRATSVLAKVRSGFRSTLNNLLYETVPVHDTYSPE